MTIFSQIAARIIREQALVIGPLAWMEAQKVTGLKVVDTEKGVIELGGDEKTIIDQLIGRYEKLFGRASHEVCREAAAPLLAELEPVDIPASLK